MNPTWQAVAIFGTGTLGAILLVASAIFWFFSEVAPPQTNQRWQERARRFLDALERTPWRKLPLLVVQGALGVLIFLGHGVSLVVRRDILLAVVIGPVLSGVIFGITRSWWLGIILGIVFVVVGFVGWSGFDGLFSSPGHSSASGFEILCMLIYPFAALIPVYEWIRFGAGLAPPTALLVFGLVLPFYGFPLLMLLTPILSILGNDDIEALAAFGLTISIPFTLSAAWLGGAPGVTPRFLIAMSFCHLAVLLVTIGGLLAGASSLLRLLIAAIVVVSLDALLAAVASRVGLQVSWAEAWDLVAFLPSERVRHYVWPIQTLFLGPVIVTVLSLLAAFLRSVVAMTRWFADKLRSTHVKPAGVLAASCAVVGAALSAVAFIWSTYASLFPTR